MKTKEMAPYLLAVPNWQWKIKESAVNGLAVILPELAVKKWQLCEMK